MFPPLPAYTRSTQRGSDSPFCEHSDNKNDVVVNATTTKLEANNNAPAQIEEGGAPEISKKSKPCNRRRLVARIVIAIGLVMFTIWAVGGIGTSINHHLLRDKEAAFTADCNADGGRLEYLNGRLPFWGAIRIECRIDEDGARETRSYETIGGRVVVWH